MKFKLFVEGDVEQRALPSFMNRWLNQRLPQRVGVEAVNFVGCDNYCKDIAASAHLNLTGKKGADVIAGIGLLDLYGLQFYPKDRTTVAERYSWAQRHLETLVNQPKFHQHFATHETEAWLLSDPNIFPREIASVLSTQSKKPETVNFREPPAKLLTRLYREKLGTTYNKRIDGTQLFRKLDPHVAHGKCDYLRSMLEQMLDLAKEALK